MSRKAVAWTLLAVLALTAVVLFNYWAAYQPLSTLVYSGIVMALCGLANLIVPFRFLGVRKRAVGVLIGAGGIALAFVALVWPAATLRVAHPGNRLDEIMPEYQFFERHSARIHARPDQVMLAIRQSTFGDMKSLVTLLKVRGAFLRTPDNGAFLRDKRILEAFAESGYLSGNEEREIVTCGAWNARANRRPDISTLRQFADYREPGAVKMAYDFTVADAGAGWTHIVTETRIQVLDDPTRRGLARYWRLIVPGSGLLRRQWLDGIRRRAENPSSPPPAAGL